MMFCFKHRVTPAFIDIETLARNEAVKITTLSPVAPNFLGYKVGPQMPTAE
jgi:hypothetical protein